MTNIFCTSFVQQRLWFLDQYEPETALYSIPAAWRIQGGLDADALEKSLNEIIRRHEVLRTTFLRGADEPLQVIAESLQIKLDRVDLSANHPGEAGVQQLIKEAAQHPFNLEKGPLIRACLFKFAQNEFVFLLVLHHIVSDGWSTGILAHELSVLYRAFTLGQPSPLSELPIQYADFAVWQREWLQGEALQVQLDYWKLTLEGAPPLLELPTDHLRPALLSHRGASKRFELSTVLSENLSQLSQRNQVTLFMTMAAVFNVLLHRYSQQDDVCIGYPVSNRNRPEMEGLIGLFVNTLVLRTRLNPQQTFNSLLKQVRSAILEADAYQNFPFERLVAELRPERNTNYSPLFQVMFAFYNAEQSQSAANLDLHGAVTSILPSQSYTAKFDISVNLMVRKGNIFGAIEYSTGLFHEETIERMVGHFKVLLEAVVANPNSRVQDLPLLTEAERHQILVEWNNTKAEFPQDKCIHQLFEEQVERSPDAVAVVFEDQQLTYAQLNAKANQLAHYLRGLGVKPDTLVAICVERSLEMVIGLLGILKAGGAYVPLDPDYPEERLAFMLQDTDAPMLLTQSHLRERVPRTASRVVCLDSEWGEIGNCAASNPPTFTSPLNLAYCIYTSGSTGNPKGVLISHFPLVNLVFDWIREEAVAPTDRFSLWTSIGFDVSAWEWLVPFVQGASLTIPTENCRTDPSAFLRWVEAAGVTTAYLAPQIARAVPSLSLEGVPVPAKVLLGVEPLKERSLFGSLRSRVVNGYGPTEATVYATVYRQPLQPIDRNIPIGTPISNTGIYILDGQLNPVPVGVPGEIHISGAGLARGYVNRPDLTAEKFIPNSFGQPGSRMYRTGDLARYLPDGNIEFLGRIDHQVKIRGFRIELGEVETALQRCEGVCESVVLAREDEPGHKQLVAYVVPMAGAPIIANLRMQLSRILPEPMIPTAWVFLDALPLTRNGKIDRKALPAPHIMCETPGINYVAPRNATEKLLASIWAEVLKCNKVGIHDDFFSLGGTSVLAVRVANRMSRALGKKMSVRSLYSNPSIAKFISSERNLKE